MDNIKMLIAIPRQARDDLTNIAHRLGFKGYGELVRAALVEYCRQRGERLTDDDLNPGQWGGRRDKVEREES